jgi:hypothetical protein
MISLKAVELPTPLDAYEEEPQTIFYLNIQY